MFRLASKHRPFWLLLLSMICVVAQSAAAQEFSSGKTGQNDKFRQMEDLLPTPNVYRTASGAPGNKYWQQRADYKIDVELDDEQQRIIGQETITYQNNSPDTLSYLWLQLEPNIFSPNSDAQLSATDTLGSRVTFRSMRRILTKQTFDGSVKITGVKGADGKDLRFTVVKTLMRIDLPKPLASGKKVEFSVGWHYKITDAKVFGMRTGYEFFKDDGNYIYEMAQWFPKLAAYTDIHGWQLKQYLGTGEFTLEFGDYLVNITAPNDHVVTATGVLQNSSEVLTEAQQKRWEEAQTAEKPIFIVTPEEAKANEKSKPSGKKTWSFKADNVRDFAFASSRKFIWDAQLHDVEGNHVMAMSFYPNEGEPLWSKYSTHSIIHTLNVYSRYTFTYPYPTAISVNGPVGGMEYPMICFNGPRPEKDGTYSKGTKYGLISVIIHEVGHNYFPMIVNSDERRWMWMDEGLNTFLQYLSEREWEDEYPSRRGEPRDIVGYMRSTNQVPIMTQSDSILQVGPNAYAKPATALNILRETILGRELFDFAFKEYAMRWKFKRPAPADLFRTMEDASGVDLDWFWRGWFYTTDHTDLSIDDVYEYELETGDPDIDKPRRKQERDERPVTLSAKRNKDLPQRADKYPELVDFYNNYDPLDVTDADREAFESYMKRLDGEDKAILKMKKYFYGVKLSNVGGLVMPVILELQLEDGSKEEIRIPAEIWRKNNRQVSKMVVTTKPLKAIVLDPHQETADVETHNNHFPRQTIKSRFKLYKSSRGGSNDMRRHQEAEKKKLKKAETEAKAADKKAAEEKKAAEKKRAELKAAEEKASAAKKAAANAADEKAAAEKKQAEVKAAAADKAAADKKSAAEETSDGEE